MEQKTKDEVLSSIRHFSLPRYEEIPNVGLYLEQTSKYISEYISRLGDFTLTGSMISNYVKKGLVKNPVKKQYDREHIARLLVIAVSKTVLSLEEIQQLLAGHPEGQQGYEAFCATLLGQLEEAFEKPPRGLLPDTMCAVAQKLYLERTFRETEA